MQLTSKLFSAWKGKVWRKYRQLGLQTRVRTLLSLPLLTKSPLNFRNAKFLILLLEHELHPPLYIWAITQISKQSVNTLRALLTELPSVLSLSITPGSAEPATYSSTSRQIIKYYARKKLRSINMQTTGSTLQPLKSEVYIHSSAPAGTGSNPTYRLPFYMGEESSH